MAYNSCEKDHSCANSADGGSGENDSSEVKGCDMEGEHKQAPPVSSTEEKKGSGAVQVLDTVKDDVLIGEATPQDKSTGVPKEGPSGVASEKTDETQDGKETGQLSGAPVGLAADKSADKSADMPADKSADKSANMPADKSADKSANMPADVPADVPADKSANMPAGVPADVPTDDVCVKRIINVEITKEIKSFIETFTRSREQIIDWCYKNRELYASKINDKTINLFFQKTKNIHLLLNEESINIDTLNVLLYFYNLYCTHNNMEKINAHSVMCSSYITYRGIYENINQNSKSFKNLLKEEKAYNKLVGKTNNINDFFSNYKKTYPYGINLILGIFLTFLSGYYGSLLLGFTKFTTRLICGIVFSYATLILEVIIFIIINEKVENLKRSQKSAGSNYGLYEKVYIKKESGGKGEVDAAGEAQLNSEGKAELNAVGEAELVVQGKVQEMKGVTDKHPTLKQRRKA